MQLPPQGPPFHGPNQGPMQNQQHFEARPRQHNALGNRSNGAPQMQKQEDTRAKEEILQQPKIQPLEDLEKLPKVTCFNCAECRHFSIDCKAPKVCFICQTAAHVGIDFPEWWKPLEPTQYLGSVAQGLGFFHVEVQEEENRGGYLKFLDNFAILTIGEGEIETTKIVEKLVSLFDRKWHWQLRKMEEYKYLVKFPPHK
jgi:hypothetical protein